MILSFSSALEFSSPSTIVQGENFSISISSSQYSGINDVKAYVMTKEGKIISEIFSGSWKSPFYYLPSAFPDQKDFLIKVVEYSPSSSICIKLRNSETKKIEESCSQINILAPLVNQTSSNEMNFTSYVPKALFLSSPEETTTSEGKMIKSIAFSSIFFSLLLFILILHAYKRGKL